MSKPKFQVGQFITYDCSGMSVMKDFVSLNGSIGLVLSVIDRQDAPKLGCDWAYHVHWMVRMDSCGELLPETALDTTYDGSRGFPEFLLKAIEIKGEQK